MSVQHEYIVLTGLLTTHCSVGVRNTSLRITLCVAGFRITDFLFGHVSRTHAAAVTSAAIVSSVTHYKKTIKYRSKSSQHGSDGQSAHYAGHSIPGLISANVCINVHKYVDLKTFGCHDGHQEVSRCHTRSESEEYIAHKPRILLLFKTQDRRH